MKIDGTGGSLPVGDQHLFSVKGGMSLKDVASAVNLAPLELATTFDLKLAIQEIRIPVLTSEGISGTPDSIEQVGGEVLFLAELPGGEIAAGRGSGGAGAGVVHPDIEANKPAVTEMTVVGKFIGDLLDLATERDDSAVTKFIDDNAPLAAHQAATEIHQTLPGDTVNSLITRFGVSKELLIGMNNFVLADQELSL